MKALRIILNNHISDFETMLRNIMDSMLNRRTICYNFRNLQEFQLERKTAVHPNYGQFCGKSLNKGTQ